MGHGVYEVVVHSVGRELLILISIWNRLGLAGRNRQRTVHVRTISGEIATEYQSRMTEGMDVTELIRLVDQIVIPYHSGAVCVSTSLLRSRIT